MANPTGPSIVTNNFNLSFDSMHSPNYTGYFNQTLWSSPKTTTTGKATGPVYPSPHFVLAMYILMGIVALVGIVGNVCVCFIVIRGKKMYTIANLFLMNLAVADICVLAICYPLTIIRNVMNWPFGAIVCKVLPSISDSFYGVSMGCITAIAIYRYRMILHPMTSHISFKHAKITVVVIWIMALCVISVPLCWVLQLKTAQIPTTGGSSGNHSLANFTQSQAFLNETLLDASAMGHSGHVNPTTNQTSASSLVKKQVKFKTIRRCLSNWPSPSFREVYQIVQISWYILPLSVILFTYMRIRTYLKKTMRYEWTKSGNDSAPQTGLTSRVIGIKRALTLLAPVVITFALLMFPWNLIRFLSLVMDIKSEIKYIFSYIEIAGAMMIANSCSNPFIYYIMSKDFRDEFRRQFRLLTRCYKQTHGDNTLNQCSFKTRVEMFSNDDSQYPQPADNADELYRPYDKYSAKENDLLITRSKSNQFATPPDTQGVATGKEQETEPLFDPDRETIL